MLGVWAVVVVLMGCGSDSTPATGTQAPQGAAVSKDAITSLAEPGYTVWRGAWPGTRDSLTLHLTAAKSGTDSRATAFGYAAIVRTDGEPISVTVRRLTADSLVLEEAREPQAGSVAPDALWRLVLRNGVLTGTRSGQTVSLRTEPMSAGRTSFSVDFYADSVSAVPSRAESPHASFEQLLLLPTSGPAALRAQVVQILSGDSAGGPARVAPATTAAEIWAKFRREERAGYATMIAEAIADGTDPAEGGLFLNYEQQLSTQILDNTPDVLALAVFRYVYSGGAHGMESTELVSFDARTGRRFTYRDVFFPTAKAGLEAALTAAVRRKFGIDPASALNDSDALLQVDKLPVTQNVALTSGGVYFLYHPYEIAAYAAGEIGLFLPFRELRGLLRPGLPAADAAAL